MTPDERKIYNIGLEKMKSDEVDKLSLKFIEAKAAITASFEEPFSARDFKQKSDDLINAAQSLCEAMQELDKIRKEI